MTAEMFSFAIVLAIVFCIGIIVLSSCLAYRKGRKEAEAEIKRFGGLTRFITTEELNKIVDDFIKKSEDEDKDFSKFIQDCIEGKEPPKDMQDLGVVEAVADCKGYDCPASPSREDCCNCIGKDGKCHFLININKVCNIKDTAEAIKNREKLLTPNEVQMLADALEKYNTIQETLDRR